MSNDQRDQSSKGGPVPGGATKAAGGKEDWIGAHLRKVYDEALNEPVPDRFLALLKEIDKKERGA